MATPHFGPEYAQAIASRLAARGLTHLRARKHGELVVIESGPKDDPIRHVRLRRDTIHLWWLEAATHTGRWQKTGFRGTIDQLLDLLVTQLPWTVAPHE
jgi:hypothetical protein